MRKSNDQKSYCKSTSLQAWSKLTEKYFNRKLRVEDRKDREHIYTLMRDIGLPCEDFLAFKRPEKLKKENFCHAIKKLGSPYWISATPKIGVTDLNRLSKLRIQSIEEGWNFIKTLPRQKDYKIILMQYADNPNFKGSVLVSGKLNGVADFVLGDRHVQLIEGLTATDPMLFNHDEIIRYSTLIAKRFQKEIWSYISKHSGHFEFQYGKINSKRYLSFFDYNDEPAYEDIDKLHKDLVNYYRLSTQKNIKYVVRGLPTSLGKASGICRVILSSEFKESANFKEGSILVTDATNPTMTPFMGKAAAIITDLGGVTSHAAIVCRELKIPCISGTINATTKIKNGDKVVIDAYKGIVQKI